MQMLKYMTVVLALAFFAATAGTAPAQAPAAPQPGSEAVKPAPPENPPAQKATPAPGAPAETKTSDANSPAGTQSQSPFDFRFILILVAGFVLLWFFTGRSRRKQEAKRKEMLANLKKGDKVTSIGGIVGTVVEVREDEVLVKVDETNNVRMRFARWAIRGVGDDAKVETPDQRQDKK